ARNAWFKPINQVGVGEDMSLLVAIEWLKEMEFKQVVFSLDSKEIVDAFNSPKRERREMPIWFLIV
ncbi:hypothetical protein A2U01_0019884, partial [Trifolium medium]|nr:hypothetical protein [Trifolium medium]